MNDKYQELLEQYDLTIHSTFRSKGTFQCETSEGLAILSEYHSSLHRLAQEYEWKEALHAAGFEDTDRCFISRDESLVVYDRYHTPFVLRHYYRGRECDCSKKEDVRDALTNLARLHRVSRSLPDLPSLHTGTESIESLFIRRNRELKKIRSFMSHISRKRSFELLYIAHFQSFYEEACRTLEALHKLGGLGGEPESGICHGAYHHHNILFLPEGRIATTGFESICYQPFLMDFYLFMRKVLEKNRYDHSYFEAGLEGYGEIRPISGEDRQFLYFLFLYPEKFWKISNRYFNHRKSWISPKMEEKLTRLLDQEEDRQHFLCWFASTL